MKPEMALIAPLVEAELDRILASPQFANADRLQRFLRYVVNATIEGDTDHLKESVIGVQVFDREIGYDPKLDPVVRVTARRLREKLELFYAVGENPNAMMIQIPKGGYVPQIVPHPMAVADEPVVIEFPEPVVEPEPESPANYRAGKKWWIVSAAAVLVAALAIWRPWTSATRSFTGPVSRFSIDLPADQLIVSWYGNNLAFSPDGRQIAYIARQNSKLRLFIRDLKDGASTLVPDTGDSSAPFFAPDGQSIAVYRPGEIRRYFLRGGSERIVEITPRFGLFGAVWDPKAGILFNDAPPLKKTAGSSSIFFLPPGKPAQPLRWTPNDQPNTEARMIQQVLPDGSYLYSVNGIARSIGIYSPSDGSSKVLTQDAKGGLYLPTGHLVFWRGGNLMIAPMSVAQKELPGAASILIKGVGDTGWQGPDIAVSQEGTLAYVPRASIMPDRRLVWVDLSGHETPVPIPPGPIEPMDLSRDGQNVLLARFNLSNDMWSLWSYRFSDGSSRRLSEDSSTRVIGCWAADGRSVFFSMSQSGGKSTDMYRKSLDDDSQQRLTEVVRGGNFPQTTSADGKWLFYVNGMQADTKSDIWAVPVDGGKPMAIVRTPDFDTNPSISPDGKWLAYSSQTAGLPYVYIRSFPGDGPAIRVSEISGTGPLWDPTGRKLYFRRGTKMAVASFDPAHAEVGAQRELFAGVYMYPEIWDRKGLISPDGKRFLLVREEVEPSEGHRINFVTNWFSEISALFRSKRF
jgi:Tol biopolymer transport system component